MSPKPSGRRKSDAGITLIEIMVSMAIFGLIGTAGFTMLDQTLRSHVQTEGRLERLGAMQRVMYLINLDFLQAQGHSYVAGSAQEGTLFALQRAEGDRSLDLRYALRDGVLLRELGAPPATRSQMLITGLEAADLRYRAFGDTEWRDNWPPEPPPQGKISANPKAVEVTLVFGGREDSIRRVVILPDGMP
jgi:general secretion pathway protein J